MAEYADDDAANDYFDEREEDCTYRVAQPSKPLSFVTITWDQFERMSNDSCDYVETEVDGKKVISVILIDDNDNERCVAVWYQKAEVGSMCLTFPNEDVCEYTEKDPNWPYGW